MPYKEGRRWRGSVRFTSANGDKIRRTQLFERKKDAVQWEDKIRKGLQKADAEKRDDLSSVGVDLMIGQWAEAYMDYAVSTWSKKTCDEKNLAFRRFFAISSDPKQLVTEVGPNVALSHLLAVLKKTSGNTANKDRKNLSAAWNWGVRYMSMDKANPFQTVDKMPENRHPRHVPPLKDFQKVVGAATQLQQQLLLLAFYTAARRGELWKLKKSEINLDKGLIGFWTNKRKSGNAEFDELPLSSMLKKHLIEWQLMAGDEELVFGTKFKGLLDINNRWLRKLCAEVGVKSFGYHGIRHLAATIAIDNGATILEVQQLLRHKSIATTQRYILKAKKRRGAVEALDAALQNQEKNPTVSLEKVA